MLTGRNPRRPSQNLLAAALVAAVALLLGACDKHESPEDQGRTSLTVWFHTGQAAERETLERQVARFNAAQDEVVVHLVLLPEGGYNTQVQAAALSGELPDVLDLDGPYLYSYAWQGHLRPLDDLLPLEIRSKLLPSLVAQGTYANRLYAVGTFDSGLGLWANRRKLAAVNARLPAAPAEAWSAEEFDELLAKLAERDPDGAVLDLKLNYPPEWRTYAFSPLLQSAGADLIDRHDYRSASGVLNGPAAVAAMSRIQKWFTRGYVDPNIDDAAFTEQRVALSWAGHWEYARYREALGEDLALVPLPDFGRGSHTGQGSWAWAITDRCDHPQAAARFLAFLLRPDEVLAMSRANGAVPATQSAIARSPLYGPGGPLRLFVTQLQTTAVPRPRTPAYPVISAAFAQAFDDVRNGVAPQQALDRAALRIDQEIADNRGYPPPP
jgi:multiple sugar transport system substrate-binding protein